MLAFLKPKLYSQYTALACAAICLLVVTASIGEMSVVLCMALTWLSIYFNLTCLVGSVACPTWGWLSLLGPVMFTLVLIMATRAAGATASVFGNVLSAAKSADGSTTATPQLTRKDRRRH